MYVCLLDESAMKGVPLEVMLRFNRLKALSNDEAAVASALRKSTSGLMEVRSVVSLIFLAQLAELII